MGRILVDGRCGLEIAEERGEKAQVKGLIGRFEAVLLFWLTSSRDESFRRRFS